MCVSCVRALKSAACLLTKTASSSFTRNSLTKTPLIGGTRNVWSLAKFRQTLPTVAQAKGINWRGWNTISACYNHSDGNCPDLPPNFVYVLQAWCFCGEILSHAYCITLDINSTCLTWQHAFF